MESNSTTKTENIETSEEQELIVIVQTEEPSPNCEQTDQDDEITDTKFTVIIEEEHNNQDQNDNIKQMASMDNKSSEAQNSTDTETLSNNHNEGVKANLHTNSATIIRFDNETSKKRPQKDIEAAKEIEDTPDATKKRKVELFTDIPGPEWYNVKGNLATRSIIAKNLPKLYESMPIYGRPEINGDLEKFYSDKLREFIGPDIDNDEFEELAKYCSPESLKTGQELQVKSPQSHGMLSTTEIPEIDKTKTNLCILKKCQMRMEKDIPNNYSIKLKYRGVRMIQWNQEDEKDLELRESDDVKLEPGKDILYRLRIYRPYTYHVNKERCTRGRHSVFSCDMVVVGRLPLSAVRDRIVCHNDVDMRVDVSDAPHTLPPTTAKEVFPSGFLFINNTFYVDSRPGCKDHSRIIREWATRRGLGEYPVKDMGAVSLDDVVVRLGYPEVYVHQGDCEHVFTFSEIRLLSPSDPLRLSSYPRHSSVSQHQTVYCTTCAEFSAKWVVVGCSRVPFDPAFFCDTCFKQYLYIDGVKIGDFKAYSYRGNETNTLRPCC